MTFDFFVLPFFIGLLILLGILIHTYSRWIREFSSGDKARVRRGLFTVKTLYALKEVVMESLLHRNMFKRNLLLGYMHMSFAFGWFMLILTGNIESRIYSNGHINPPYYPIFLKYFVHDKRILTFELTTLPGIFRFLMDFFLLMILSGLILALIKRARSKWFGMKKTTRHVRYDRIAITTLWLIFPLRLLAESFTAGMYYGGGFLTNNLGRFFASFLPVEYMAYPAWWAYSTALGIFFVTLPYSRFMHIPTEVLLIFFRHWGIKTTNQPGSYSRFEVHSCPRCGVCLDACPVYSVKQNGTPPVYFLRTIRENRVEEKTTYDCLLCGRCQVYCPVGIDNNPIRIAQRSLFQPNGIEPYNYLAPPVAQKADVAYFAGCMTHLTPSVIRSMDAIFRSAGIEYAFLDANATICCGRPLMMAGKEKQAHMLREHNYRLIKASGCHTLVTSCPICYKVFQEDYGLTIRVLHHTQYLHELSHSGRLNLRLTDIRAVFHDPCELGRGSGIYEPPREVIRSMAHLVEGAHEKEDSVCCGGSLGNLEIKAVDRDGISQIALEGLISQNPEVIITACPLCKKTLQKNAPVKVADICEMAAANLIDQPQKTVRQLFCVMEFP